VFAGEASSHGNRQRWCLAQGRSNRCACGRGLLCALACLPILDLAGTLNHLVFAQLQALEQAARSCCGCGVWRACAPALFTKGQELQGSGLAPSSVTSVRANAVSLLICLQQRADERSFLAGSKSKARDETPGCWRGLQGD